MCEHFGQLPRPGGLLDQDCYLAVLMDIVVTEKKDKEAEDNHRDEVRAKNRRGHR
jgi:hypothetical protein